MKAIIRNQNDTTETELRDITEEMPEVPVSIPEDISIEIHLQNDFYRVGRFNTFVNLTNAIIGAGVVAVPYTFRSLGLGPNVVLLAFVCFLDYICGCILINIQQNLNIKSVLDLATRVYGKGMSVLSAILSTIFTYSCTTSYLIIGTDMITSWLSLAGVNLPNIWWRSLVSFLYSVCIPVALTIPKHLSFLQSLSLVITAIIVIYSIIIFVESALLLAKNGLSPTARGCKFSYSVFTSFSVHVSTFALPIMMLDILRPYNPNNEKRKSVTGLTYLFTFTVVTLPGALAYLVNGEDTSPDVLLSFNSLDAVIIILQVAMFCIVSLTYPFVTSTIIADVSELFFGERIQEKLSLKQRLITVPVVNIISVVLSMLFTNVAIVLGIGGALPGCLMCFVFPSLCQVKMSPWPLWNYRNLPHILLILFGFVVGIACMIYTILDAVNNFNPK